MKFQKVVTALIGAVLIYLPLSQALALEEPKAPKKAAEAAKPAEKKTGAKQEKGVIPPAQPEAQPKAGAAPATQPGKYPAVEEEDEDEEIE